MSRFKIKYYNSKLKRLEIESEKEIIIICEDYFLINKPKDEKDSDYYTFYKSILKLTNGRYYNLIINSILKEEDFEHIIECILYHKLESFEIENITK